MACHGRRCGGGGWRDVGMKRAKFFWRICKFTCSFFRKARGEKSSALTIHFSHSFLDLTECEWVAAGAEGCGATSGLPREIAQLSDHQQRNENVGEHHKKKKISTLFLYRLLTNFLYVYRIRCSWCWLIATRQAGLPIPSKQLRPQLKKKTRLIFASGVMRILQLLFVLTTPPLRRGKIRKKSAEKSRDFSNFLINSLFISEFSEIYEYLGSLSPICRLAEN